MLYIDISELARHPISTGIQRVVRRLLTDWPSKSQASICALDHSRSALAQLPQDFVDQIVRQEVRTADEKRAWIEGWDAKVRRCDLCKPKSDDTVLVPEVFYDPDRIRFYEQQFQERPNAPKILAIIYDIMPWSNPEAFEMTTEKYDATLPYLLWTMKLDGRIFISTSTAAAYSKRVLRQADMAAGDAVLRLGADALDIPRQSFSPKRKDLVCIGSFDGKKGQDVIYEAFASRRFEHIEKLVFIGARSPQVPENLEALLGTDDPRVVKMFAATDADIKKAFRTAIGSIFVSKNEGFGLPPVESLFCGVPVIAYRNVPSLVDGPGKGIFFIDDVSVASVAEALTRFDRPEVHEALWDDVKSAQLGTWAEFASASSSWACEFKA